MRPESRALLAEFASLAFLVLACDHTPGETKPTPLPCTFGVSSGSLSFTAAGGTASVTVTAAAGCQWTAVSDRGWITIDSGASGTGSGSVAITVAANPTTDARTGTLTIAGQVIAVRVDAADIEPCTFTISPSTIAFGHDAATGQFTITTPAQCLWSARSTEPWLSITSAVAGAGNATIAFAVARNTDAASRTGAIAIADRLFVVTQSGDQTACQYAVAPVEVRACMAVPTELTTAIDTLGGCTWTADAGAAWIALRTPQAGNGAATIRFTLSDNWDAPRQALLMIRWPTPTVGQNVRVSQAGCRYAVSVTDLTIGAAGGPLSFDVLQQSDPLECGGPLQDACVWTALSSAPDWITISSPATQRGDQRVSLVVAENHGAAPRTGVVTVRDKTVTVTQTGR